MKNSSESHLWVHSNLLNPSDEMFTHFLKTSQPFFPGMNSSNTPVIFGISSIWHISSAIKKNEDCAQYHALIALALYLNVSFQCTFYNNTFFFIQDQQKPLCMNCIKSYIRMLNQIFELMLFKK